MRALINRLREDGVREKVLMEDWEDVPEPTGNLIKTHTIYSGITNGTERNDLVGGNYATPEDKLPAPWGYQNVGRVVGVGPDVKSVKIGDVLYSSANHFEYALFDENFLYCKVPDTVNPHEAALFGMASVAMRSCRNSDIRMGEQVLVVGAGFIGQIATQIATHMGGRVTLVDIDQHRLDIAKDIGAAEHVINVGGDVWHTHIKDFTYEVIIDVAGVPGMEDKLVAAAKPRGRVLFIAGREKVCYSFNNGQGHEITIKQNSHFDNYELANLCRLVERGIVTIKPMIKDIVPVGDAQKIYDTLRDHPEKLYGTIFEW